MDTSPTALFDSYEQDFLQFIETIREKLETNSAEDAKGGGKLVYMIKRMSFTTLISERTEENDAE